MTDRELMELAIEQAQAALAEGEVPVGCVLAVDGEPVALGHNRSRQKNDPTAHAEIEAIRALAAKRQDWRLSDAQMYVTLEPCPMCAGAIVQARIKKLSFGARDVQAGCAGSVYRITEDPAFVHFCPADGGLLEEKCAQLLKKSFTDARSGLNIAQKDECNMN